MMYFIKSTTPFSIPLVTAQDVPLLTDNRYKELLRSNESIDLKKSKLTAHGLFLL